MLVSAVVAGLLVGLAFGGDVRRIASVRVQWLGLLLVAFALRLLGLAPLGDANQRLSYAISLFILVAFTLANWRVTAAPLATLGIASNAIVVALHQGAMPVSSQAIEFGGFRGSDALHIATTDPTPLGDVIPIPPFGIYSIGDLLLAAAVFIFVVDSMRPTR
jgi:hypothetical protein